MEIRGFAASFIWLKIVKMMPSMSKLAIPLSMTEEVLSMFAITLISFLIGGGCILQIQKIGCSLLKNWKSLMHYRAWFSLSVK